jgi:hypothetical protein
MEKLTFTTNFAENGKVAIVQMFVNYQLTSTMECENWINSIDRIKSEMIDNFYNC